MKMVSIFVSVIVLSLMSALSFAGGVYTGTVKPYYYNDALYLQPVNITKVNLPACATRGMLRLIEAPGEEAFKNKNALILAAWMAKQELEYMGNGECTSEGDEYIFAVRPK